MSMLTVDNKRRMWPLLTVLVILVVMAVAVGFWLERPGAVAPAEQEAPSGQDAPEGAPDSPQALWEAQALEDYRYTLQVGCFCPMEITRPVVIEVRDGAVASITYADDGATAEASYFERYDSIDDLFAIIDDARAQDPVRLDVTYAEETGVPLSVDIDISELMADEELFLTVSAFEAFG